MEKEIENLKRIYLKAIPTMDEEEGFMDLTNRIKLEENKVRFYFSKTFIAAVLFFGFLLGVMGFSYLFPKNTTVNAVKSATEKTYNSILHNEFKILDSSMSTIKKATPTPTVKIEKHNSIKTETSSGKRNWWDIGSHESRDVKSASTSRSKRTERKDRED